MVKTSLPQPPAVFASSKVRVQVSADGCIYEGNVHLHGDARRIQEVLNDPRPFLNLTDVRIAGEGSSTTDASYVALNKGAITHVLLIGDEAAAVAGAGALLPGGGGATQPVLPARGPVTRPLPTAAAEEEAEELSVSDLLIEDEDGNDDLDLGDFE